MNALDMLQAYLQQAGMSEDARQQALLLQQQMGRGDLLPRPQPTLPSYLPDTVRRSILDQPSYAEGQQMPGPRNPAMEQEYGARFGPRREDELLAALGRAGSRQNDVMPDAIPDAWLKGGSYGYPSALNSMMGRYPLALY